jgi:predicted enzyme related to lactoylglutathione lyase
MIMPNFDFLLLHVADEAASATFYNEMLGLRIVDQRPGFAMLALREGVMLGLWGRDTVEPASSGQTGASELSFAVADAETVEAMHGDWWKRGLTILQAPTAMGFGMTFVAADPDGHRLRIYAPTR